MYSVHPGTSMYTHGSAVATLIHPVVSDLGGALHYTKHVHTLVTSCCIHVLSFCVLALCNVLDVPVPIKTSKYCLQVSIRKVGAVTWSDLLVN